MDTIRTFKKLWLFIGVALAMAACEKEEEETELEVNTDSYIIQKNIEGEVRFAPAFYAYSNKSLESVTVTPPTSEAGSAFELETVPDNALTYAKEPDSTDYQAQMPVTGDYLFEAVSEEGITVQQTDLMEPANLDIPEITTADYQGGNSTMEVKWETVSGANGYVVKIVDLQGKTIFMSYGVSADSNSFTVNQDQGQWIGTTYNGEDYLVQVQAYAYDSDANEENFMYNIKEVSIGEFPIVWGQ